MDLTYRQRRQQELDAEFDNYAFLKMYLKNGTHKLTQF